MKANIHVPNSLRNAGRDLRLAIASPLDKMPHTQFIRAWSAIAYLFPGLHPDGFEDMESGWPKVLKPFAVEAWRRAGAGELTDDELYPCDAQWSGLYDRMHTHKQDEMDRRLMLAADFGEAL